MKINNSVGNDWSVIYKTKNQIIKNNSQIINSINEVPKFYCEIIEKDKFPDIGIAEFIFYDNQTTITKELTIVENKGKYINNTAIWEVKCIITIKEYI